MKSRKKFFKNRRTQSRRNAQRRRLRTCESLEDRRLFVVGALELPDTISPGSPYDGVVDLSNCSATLLESGRHILTAAHCLTSIETQDILFSEHPPTASLR